MLSVKQGSIEYHFFSLWYDAIWDWTQASRAMGKQTSEMSMLFSFLRDLNDNLRIAPRMNVIHYCA